MRFFILTILFVFVGLFGYSSQGGGAQAKPQNKVEKNLISSNGANTIFSIDVTGFNKNEVLIENQNYYSISSEGMTFILQKGAPDLAKTTTAVIIPEGEMMNIEIIKSDYTDYPNILVAPSKGNLYRTQVPQDIAYEFSDVYKKDAFYPGKLAELSKPYILKDFQGQTATIYPFQYNPVTKILRVYHHLEISISPKNKSNSLIKTLDRVNDNFNQIYVRHFINYNTNSSSRYTPVEEEGKMLIICPDEYLSAMQPFVDWKNQRGLETEMVSLTTVGNTETQIKSFVKDYYTEKGLTYLLLVGDAEQITNGNTSAGNSDNQYGYILGDDSYPEVFVGRFSAENLAQVNTQVLRSINYEKNISNGDWLAHAVTIGSTEGGNGMGDDGEIDWQHQRNIKTDEMMFTYNYVYELYDGSQGGNDATGNPSSSNLLSAINSGASVITYTGHGSANSFVTSNFYSSNISQLTNSNRLPFIWSVACQNGNFVGRDCFAESWLRATDNSGNPTGAIATLMSTIDQSWDPPMCAQDEMIDILTQQYASNKKQTFGGISMSGCMRMNDEYQSGGYVMTDTWNCFGDPSLLLRTFNAQAMTISHDSVVLIGTTQIPIQCDVDDAVICLSINNKIIGKGIASGGVANISITSLTEKDTIWVTATAFNKITYIGFIIIQSPKNPYVVFNNMSIVDSAGNNNGIVDYKEKIDLDLSLKNLGYNSARGITAKISTIDPSVKILIDSAFYGNIDSLSVKSPIKNFSIIVSDSVLDKHSANLIITIRDSVGTSWKSYISLNISAPILFIDNYLKSDSKGNNDFVIDPGENIELIIFSKNIGHADYLNASGVLTTSSPDITITEYRKDIDTITTSAKVNSIFNIAISPNATIGSQVSLLYTLGSGLYQVSKSILLTIGIKQEDWELANFNKYEWIANDSISKGSWTITSENPYEGSYCSKSGKISNNQSSILSINIYAAKDDSISFYKKTSCEDGLNNAKWDYLEFLIDNVSMGFWDGNTPWSRSAFIVSTGTHNLKWVYKKDEDVSSGSDCAWIDEISFPASILSVENLNPNTKQSSINVFPNPCKEYLTLEFLSESNGNAQISVCNIMGETVISPYYIPVKEGAINTETFDFRKCSAGVYLIKIQTNNGFLSKRIIVGE